MAGADYTHGEMDIAEQERTWNGFMTGSVWGGLLIMLVVAHSTFTLAMGMHWMVSLVLCLIGGVVAGMALNLGGAWLATTIGMAVLAVIVQIFIGIFSMLG
ncbi:MAG: aa3-type cytochrome c oxidase subunit IV [Pseudomonadota bacterium]